MAEKYSERFLKIIPFVIDKEGGYVLTNRKDDRGGMTYAGVARNKNPDWPGWAVVDATLEEMGLTPEAIMEKNLVIDFDSPAVREKAQNIAERSEALKGMANDLYYNDYYMKIGGDKIKNLNHARLAMSTAVLNGVKGSAGLIQEGLGFIPQDQAKEGDSNVVDGHWGDVTRNALNAIEPGSEDDVAFNSRLSLARAGYARNIMEDDPTQKKWGGWIKRPQEEAADAGQETSQRPQPNPVDPVRQAVLGGVGE